MSPLVSSEEPLEGPGEPHAARAKAILRRHPEVRALMGPEPLSMIAIAVVVLGQFVTATALRSAPAWMILATAYVVGGMFNLCIFELLHACAHNMVCKSRPGNRIAAHIANLPVIWPAADSMLRYHGGHHKYLGSYCRDVSMPRRWEAKLDRWGALGKAAWLVMYPFVYPVRVWVVNRGQGLLTAGMAANWLIQALVVVAVVSTLGFRSLAYLALSFPLGFGLNPFNGNTISEHFRAGTAQPTYSYYGVANWLTLNVGYHCEHHDFPNIPWTRIWRLRRIAPEYYDGITSYRSWVRLLIAFVTDRNWTLTAQTASPEPPIDRSPVIGTDAC